MDPIASPTPPPSHAVPPPPPPRTGLGTGAKIGIGCGAIVLLIIIAAVAAIFIYGDKIKNFADEAQKNPPRATATMMIKASGGNMSMVAEDDINQRYTVKDNNSGELTTIYWDETKRNAAIVKGDFSAIPGSPPVTGTDPPDKRSPATTEE